jgi:hypothetical protein
MVLLLQVPPVVASVSDKVAPGQITEVPAIGAGAGFTESTLVRQQPVVIVYVMVVEPGATPVAMPVVASIVATVGSLLIHVPAGDKSDNVVVLPWQTVNVPVIKFGGGFTGMLCERLQPVAAV